MKSLYIGLAALVVLFGSMNPASGQQWNFQIVDASGDMGYYSQIAVTSDGTPYVLYRSSGNSVYLAWWVPATATWSRIALCGTSASGSFMELLCDANDNLHFAAYYYLSTPGWGIYYGVFSSLTHSWVLTPERATSEGGNLDLVLVGSGGNVTPAIVYLYVGLKVATRNPSNGVWSVSTVYNASGVSGSPSVTADTNGYLHVSFYDATGANLMYATNAVGGSWGSQYVDIPGNVGTYSSIVIDTDGKPLIVYYDVTNGDLKYAKLVSP